MNDVTKIGASHLGRAAYIYLRQSTPSQVEHNRESTHRQYALAARATTLGWPSQQVIVVDEDLGLSGSGVVERNGFARLTAEVALGHVGIVLGLEVSRLARNNADWYRLLDLCGLTNTLIGDADGIYHPAMFNDRLLLGLKGTMSEAELHIIRARLNGGIRNKAARGELRRGLPVGFIWGEEDGEVRFHPDEAVCSTIRTVFARFAELGSARRVWLWFRSEGLSFPLQTCYGGTIRWVDPSYIAIYHVLSNPAYAGAYAYGKSRREVSLDGTGARKERVRKLPRSQWSVFIPNHHEGFIDMATYEANRTRITANTHPRPHQPSGGAVREGSALLQGVAVCGHCGRKLRTHYTGRTASAGYHCAGKTITNGRGVYCLSIGAVQVDQAVAPARDVAARPIEAGDEAVPDRVAPGCKDDRHRRGCGLGHQCRRSAEGRDHGHLTMNQFGREHRQSIVLALRPAVFDRDVLTFDEACLLQALAERGHEVRRVGGRSAAEKPDHRHRRLLRAYRDRPRCRTA